MGHTESKAADPRGRLCGLKGRALPTSPLIISMTDSKTLTIKVGDKNCQSNENGSIEFDDQYGHQSFGYITEFTLDLSE